MRHFFANLVAMFFANKKSRRRIRNKILGKKPVKAQTETLVNTSDLDNQLAEKQRLLGELENQLAEKQRFLNELEPKYNYLKLKAEWLNYNGGQLLLPGRFSEYDLIFGIGATCNAPEMLRYFKLRRFSNPFDWTAGVEPLNWWSQPDVRRDTRFREKMQSIFDNFKDWLNPEYYKYVNSVRAANAPHHQVVNIKNKIRFIHEFPANQDILQYFPQFAEKMSRRIKTLYTAIEQSDKILIVWMASTGDQRAILEQNVSDADIKWAVKKIQQLYPDKKFDFVFFEPDGSKGRFEYEKIAVTTGAYRIKSNHFLLNPEYKQVAPEKEYCPHVHVLSEMLDNTHLSEKAFSPPEKERNQTGWFD